MADAGMDSLSKGTPTSLAFQAAEEGNAVALMGAVNESTDLCRATNEFNQLLIHVASYNGFAEGVEFLIQSRSALDHQDKWGYTPMMQAAFYGRVEVVSLLVKSGANTNLKDIYGVTAWRHATLGNQPRVAELLAPCTDEAQRSLSPRIEKEAHRAAETCHENQRAFQAAEDGDVAALMQAVNDSSELVTAKSQFNETLLQKASRAGHVDAMQFLIRSRADVDHQDKWGYNPLIQAAFFGHASAVKLLLNARANMCLKDIYQLDALYHALSQKHEHIVEILEGRETPRSLPSAHVRRTNRDP